MKKNVTFPQNNLSSLLFFAPLYPILLRVRSSSSESHQPSFSLFFLFSLYLPLPLSFPFPSFLSPEFLFITELYGSMLVLVLEILEDMTTSSIMTSWSPRGSLDSTWLRDVVLPEPMRFLKERLTDSLTIESSQMKLAIATLHQCTRCQLDIS